MTSSANDSPSAIWRLLTKYRDAERTRIEWSHIFSGVPSSSAPLVPVVGRRADVVRDPDTGIPLQLHENRNGTFSALPPADSELDSRIDGLTIEDVRLHRLDWPTICRDLASSTGLSGHVRAIPRKPWLWRLGELVAGTRSHTYFLAVMRSDVEATSVLDTLKAIPSVRLLVTDVDDGALHTLDQSDIAFRVLSQGGTPVFAEEASARPRPRYMLRQGSGAWLFTVNGLDGNIADEKGLRYVEYLFKNPPPAPVHAIQLQADVCEVEPGKGGIVEIVDPDSGERITLSRTARMQERNLSIDNREANRRIWKIRRTWQSIVDDESASEVERDEAREQLASLDKVLSSWALREKSNASKSYDRIRQAVNRLLTHLDAKTTKDGKKDPAYSALAEHIRRHMVETSRRYSGKRTSRTRAGTAQTFMYERPDGVIWAD